MRASLFVLSTLLLAGIGCDADDAVIAPPDGAERLTATPGATTVTVAPGTYPLGVTTTRDAVLVVPASATPNAAIALIVMLHGAGGDEPPVDQVVATAEQHGVAVLIPRSRQNTWDAATGAGIGEDVVVIDQALQETFERVRVDPARIAMAGFSDGASYALMLGIANGDLFSHIIAFAPGFLNPVNRFGQPDILIVHGNSDGVTSPRNTQENIIPFLEALGYDVLFHGFDGGHQVLAPETEFALSWFMSND